MGFEIPPASPLCVSLCALCASVVNAFLRPPLTLLRRCALLSGMHLVCLDLEGVLLPEMWIAIAEATGIEALKRTTRDEPNYDTLMRYRLDVLAHEGLTLARMQEIISTLEPLPGAVEFVRWVTARTRLIILSDTFEQFAAPLMAKLGHPTLFCHTLEVGPDGCLSGWRLRQPDQKRKAVEGFRQMGFGPILAAGDSYNDLSMLLAADRGFFFCPPAKLITEYPHLPVANTHAELRALIEAELG